MSDISYVTEAVFDQYRQTAITEREALHAEDERQNQRILQLETSVAEIHTLSLSVNTLATNMQHMLEELKDQGNRLSAIESKDGKMWRSVVTSFVTGLIMLVAGFLFGKLFP